MKKTIFSLFILILILTSFSRVMAWEQPTHMAINYEAVKNFTDTYGNNDKYKNASVKLDSQFMGLYVTSSTWFAEEHAGGAFGGYEDSVETKTLTEWIMHGGYSADEPNIYESLRHFYDPLEKNGAKHLVAQVNSEDDYGELADMLMDEFINPEIDARLWGLEHEQNPYSFAAAIDYYYASMTLSEFDKVKGFVPGELFRTQAIPAEDADEQRNLYLGAAFRALGETMHLMADMTQPAHVRNDAHAFVEPIEQGTTPGMIAGYLKGGLNVSSEIGKEYFCETSGVKQSLNDLFHKTALFTNKTFFSLDTITDTTLNIKPANGLDAYDNPQITGLIGKNTTWSDFGSTTTYYQNINGDEVPMLYRNILGNYKIANSYAQKQSEVLIPIAIAGCTEVMDRLFPTMELTFNKGEAELIEDNRGRVIEKIPFETIMEHHYEQDIEWFQRGIQIYYQGPGELIIKGDKETRRIPIFFEDGKVMAARDNKEDISGEISLYRKNDAKAKLTKEQDFLEVVEGDMVWVEINAGARFFVSEKTLINTGDYQIEINPDIPFCYEEVSMNLTGTGNTEVFCEWDFGDGSEVVFGEGLFEVSHIYKKGGDHRISLILYKDNNKKKIISRAFGLIAVSKMVDVEIMPSNNLQGIPGTSSEIYVEAVNERVSLSNYRVEWDVKGISVEPNGTKAVLTFDENGEYDIYARIYNSEDKEVGRAYASLEVNENTDVITVDPVEISINPFERQGIDVYLNGETARYVEFSVVEGDEGGYFTGILYNSPDVKGNFTIKVVVNGDERLTAYIPVTVNKREGVWKFVEMKTEIVEPLLGSDSYSHYTGEVIHSDGEYWAKIIYDSIIEEDPDYEYFITAKWGAIPKILIPGEMLDIDISISVDGSYEHGKNSMDVRFFTEDNNMGIGGANVAGEKMEKAITIRGTVPKFGDSLKEAEELSIRVFVDPFYQYIGRVKYTYIYEYEYIDE